MKTRWLGVITVSLASLACALDVSGCADDTSDANDNGDASMADASVDAAPLPDAGLEASTTPDSNVPCASGALCPTSLPGAAPSLTAIFAASPARAVAGTKDGKILLWNGTMWSTIAQGYGSLTAIWGIDADHFLIAESQSWSLIQLTFDGANVAVGQELLPYDAACVPASLSISGQSATDIFVAGYCRKPDNDTGTVGFTGVLFHATVADAGPARSWSVAWSGGGVGLQAVALGSVHEMAPGEALVGGWRSRPESYPVPTTLKTPDPSNPAQPGTTTFVLHVKGKVIDSQDLAPSLAMCVQSIWSSVTMDSVFLGGVCTAVDVSDILDTHTKYTTVAHRSALGDGGVGWTPVVREAYATFFDLPGVLMGFGTGDVYAAGSYLTHWDGTTFQLQDIANEGSPLGSRVRGIHGSSASDLWLVGDRFALHRKP